MATSNNQSRASEFYREIAAHGDPAVFLQGLITECKPENDFLEFKGGSKISEKQVKEYWSQALSGFANTEGGVLIWGIRASRMPLPDDPSQKIDAATELDLVPHPESFAQLLKDVRLESTIDPVQGVEFQQYITEESGAGFVVCLIPEGIHKPYRATLTKDKQYYQRIGDSFTIIPHSLLRSLFYPQTAPDLVLEIIPDGRADIAPTPIPSPPNRQSKYTFQARISNLGTASGQEIYVRAQTNYPARWSERDCFRTEVKSNGGAFIFNRPLHPYELSIHCFSCVIVAPTYFQFYSPQPGILYPDRIVFDVAIHARDAAPVQAQLIFHPDDISNCCQKTTQIASALNAEAKSQ